MRASPDAIAYQPFHALAPYLSTGWIGVQIFFVISGFVIAYTADGKSAGSFFNSRFLRLWPGVLICATLSVPMLLWFGQSLPETLLQYAHSLAISPVGPWVSSTYWTLPVEIVFYALIFVMLWRGWFQHIERVAIALGLAGTVFWIAYAFQAMLPGAALRSLVHLLGGSNPTRLLMFQYGSFFALGIMLWLIAHRGLTARRVAVIAVLTLGSLVEIVAETGKANAWNGYPSAAWVSATVWLASMAALVAAIRWNGAVAQAIRPHAGTVRTIGLLTYPVYLLHQPLGETLLHVMLVDGLDPAAAMVFSLAVSILASWLVATRAEPLLRRAMQPQVEAVQAWATGELARLSPRRARRWAGGSPAI